MRTFDIDTGTDAHAAAPLTPNKAQTLHEAGQAALEAFMPLAEGCRRRYEGCPRALGQIAPQLPGGRRASVPLMLIRSASYS